MPADYGEPLSERELDIVPLVAEGLTNREIAVRLYISPNTVKVHLRNIFTKTGVASRTELSMLAVNERWVVVSQSGVSAPPPAETEKVAVEPPPPPWPRSRWVSLAGGLLLALGVLLLPPRRAAHPNGGTAAAALVDQPSALVAAPTLTAEDGWEELAPLPVRRARLGLVALTGRLYAVGGLTADGPTDRLDIYDIAEGLWRTGAPRPVALANAGAVPLAGKVFVPGGCDAQGQPVADAQLYDPAEDTWETLAPLPEPLCASALATFDGQVYLFGGWDGSRYRAVTYRYDPQSGEWTEQPSPQTARGFGAAAALGKRIFYVGGYDGAERAVCEVYLPAEERWESCAPLLLPRGGLGLATVGGQLYAVGGGWDNYLGFNERYNTQEDTWTVIQSPVVREWRNVGLAAWETTLYAVGGWSGDYLNRTYGWQVLPFRVFIPVTLP